MSEGRPFATNVVVLKPTDFTHWFSFQMLSFCNQTRRIAAGTKQGQIIIYDLRTLKSQVVLAHQGAVSALCFSPQGKYLATYSNGLFFTIKLTHKI